MIKFYLPDGEKCKIISCSDFSTKEECEALEFSDKGTKCVYSDENGCEFSSCYEDKSGEIPSNCEEFIPNDPLYKCVKSKARGPCILEQKECEDLSEGQCDLFNIEENLKEGKCVEMDGYCALEYSKNLEFSCLFLFLLFFLL